MSKAQFFADRHRVDGSRTVWAITSDESGSNLTRWDLVDGAWVEVLAGQGSDWIEAVAADPQVASVRPEEITEYVAADPNGLREILVPVGDGDPNEVEWPVGLDENKFEGDGDDKVYDRGHIRRWATVNGERLSWAQAEPRPVSFLGSWDRLDGEQVAYFSWDNGWGCGGSELVMHRDGVALGTSWVDQGETALWGYRCERGPHGSVAALTSWTAEIDWPAPGSALLALALEPFDPGGTVTADQREGWDKVLQGVGGGWSDYRCSIELSVSDELKALLRIAFAGHDTLYDKFKQALAAPLQNDWLRELLDEWDTRGGEW